MEKDKQPDRNHAVGGRSFYFFDFDDNVAFLPTELFLFHKITGEEKTISTQEFALISNQIGKSGPWADYKTDLDPRVGSFRRFRHHPITWYERALGRQQPLIEDIRRALSQPIEYWKGPSWDFFWHAVHNQRPISIITARGHKPSTLREGVAELVKAGHLSHEPNYLGIYPVNDRGVREKFGDPEFKLSTAQLKKCAIVESVKEAFRIYGQNPAHRFGMSDDDQHNIQLIIEAMQSLKDEYPQNSFFVIETHRGHVTKWEVAAQGAKRAKSESPQISLF